MARLVKQSMGYNKRFPKKGGRSTSNDYVELDKDKPPAENIMEALSCICIRSGVSERRKSSYLSALVTLLTSQSQTDPTLDLGLRIKEIMLCLRIPLVSECAEVRSGALRAVRYLIKNNQDAAAVFSVNMHLLIVKILDLDCERKNERIQAVKLARKLLLYGPTHYPATLVKALIAITQKEKGGKEKQNYDPMWRACLAILCELSTVNPALFISTGCAKILSQSLYDCVNLPRIVEAVIGCLMRIYNVPSLRQDSGLDLSSLVAPFTELHFHSGPLPSEENRVSCASAAVLSLLRSWSGLLHLSNPHLSTRPMQSLVDILHLQTEQSRKVSNETRRVVLDILFKSLNLQVPDWTDEFEVAMKTADPSAVRDSWKLTEGFVASEGRDILSHLSRSRPNLVENHKCFLLSCYLKCGLPQALIQVIVSSDTVLSVRGTVLLGQVLHLASLLLPHEIGSLSQSLPELAQHVATQHFAFSKSESNRAVFAATALQRLHGLKKQGPRPSSLLLEQALSSSGHHQGAASFVGDRLLLPAAHTALPSNQAAAATANDLAILNSIKESQVVLNQDPQSWKWEIVMSVLRWPSESLKRLEDSTSRAFIRKIVNFFKPSCNMFSRQELDAEKTKYYGRLGCSLLDFLMVSSALVPDRAVESEAGQALDDLLKDIFACVQEVIESPSPHDCMFSPARLTNSGCQHYFLFIGRLSSMEAGRAALDRHRGLSLLMSLLSSRSDLYLKLVVSCVDYRAPEWGGRLILSKALSQGQEAGKLYAVRWLGVLARIRAPSFAQYGVEFLVEQLKDPSLQVAATALAILDEVCDDKMYLESLVATKSVLFSAAGREALERLGDRGRLLLTRFLSSASGFSVMSSSSWLAAELAYWAEHFNKRYVFIVESLLNDGFTSHQRTMEGHGGYGRRTGDDGHVIRDVFLPPHLYGQLAQTRAGLEMLVKEKAFWSQVSRLRDLEAIITATGSACDSLGGQPSVGVEESWLEVKAALWAVSHVASSPYGGEELEREGVLATMVTLAEICPVLTVKATAFYALGQVATTRVGANVLGSRGWATVRHARNEAWPIAVEWLESFSYPLLADPVGSDPPPSPVPSVIDDDDVEEEEEERAGQRSSQQEQRQAAAVGMRRQKTTSECTESSISQTMLEVGPSPIEPSFQLPGTGKLSERISTWFSPTGSSGNGATKDDRRNSEGGKSASSFASKIRKSFRRRSRTISAGSIPSGEGTPASSYDKAGDMTATPASSTAGQEQQQLLPLVRKLSFGGAEEPVGGLRPAASPDTMPGEIFQLENIVEEPAGGIEEKNRKTDVSTAHHNRSEGAARAEGPSQARLDPDRLQQRSPLNQSFGSARSVPQLDEAETSHSFLKPAGSKEPARSAEIQLVFSAHKQLDSGMGSIRQGTSISSVSSVGSYSFQDNYGQGSLARTRIRRRPQLSESEDGEQPSSLVRKDSYSGKSKSLDYRIVRGGSHTHTPTSTTIRPKHSGLVGRVEGAREPQYWGIAYPLRHSVLYPEPTASQRSSPPPDLPGLVGAWFQAYLLRHVPSTCLACCRLKPSARPRAASLTATKDDLRTSLLLSSSLPSSYQSPEVKRKSWNPAVAGSVSVALLMDSDTAEPPANYEEAKTEALDLICLMTSVFKCKQSEQGLLRLKTRLPTLFQDLCFYSDVSQILGDYNFKVHARRFIQELFIKVNFSQMETEARYILCEPEQREELAS